MANSKELFQFATRSLQTGDSRDEVQAMAMMLVSHVTGLTPVQILAGRSADTTAADLEPLLQRLNQHEPIQYVIGEAPFLDRSFMVTPAVLIPRPETEELVQAIVQDHQADTDRLQVLDLGTGSGCIAVSLALELNSAAVTAVELSAEALQVARRNARMHQAAVKFVQQDMCAPWPTGPWDIIVSNPPYVAPAEKPTLLRNVVDHEPWLALFVPGEDPLHFYRAIAGQALQALTPSGQVWLEMNAAFAAATASLFTEAGFSRVTIVRDLYGKERMLKACR